MGAQRRPKSKHNKPVVPPDEMQTVALPARGITAETCAKYGYHVGTVDGQPVQIADYREGGDVVGQKLRTKDKRFLWTGKASSTFFGQHLWPGGGKILIITEGEIDALTVSQVKGNKYPVVSLPMGAGSAKKIFTANLEWLEQFEEVIELFDSDGPGREAAEDIQGLLSPGKLKHATIPLKDPNEMFLSGKTEELIRAIWNAKKYAPDCIVQGNDLFEQSETCYEEANQGTPLPWKKIPLNTMINGVRPAEITLVTAGSGIGKSTFVKFIGHHMGTQQNIKVGCVFLEEAPKKTVQWLGSITAGKPLHLEGLTMTKEERQKVFTETFGSGNFVFYDHFGSVDSDNLISRIRYLAVAEGCKFVILDHISIAISGIEGENERRIIDNLMTKLAVLTQETGVGIIAISHLRKTDGGKSKPHEEGGRITLDDLRGSGALKQLSWTVLALERNQQAQSELERSLILVRVLKCRETGNTGVGGHLWYDKDTMKFVEVPNVEEFLGAAGEITYPGNPFLGHNENQTYSSEGAF
nr:DnaB-like helicase C-terminal domain-containing protein [uncultured Anaeromusa sp.]